MTDINENQFYQIREEMPWKERLLAKILQKENRKKNHYNFMTGDLYNKLKAKVEEEESAVKKTPL